MAHKCIDELVRSYNDNCCAAEDAALKFLGIDIGQEHMPVVNVPTLRDLVKGDFWILLRRGKQTFSNPVEKALFLVVLTDYVTCAIRNVQLFDIFQKKTDLTRGIPSLLTYIDSHWNRLFCLLSHSPASDLSMEQLKSLMSLFKKAVNRLPTKIERDCFYQSLMSGETQLYYASLILKDKARHKHQEEKQSEDNQLSYTSIKNCETPKYELDDSLKGHYLSLNEKRLDLKPVTEKKITNMVSVIPERIPASPKVEIPKKKKLKFSSDITKYMCSVEKKIPININTSILEKNILEATSKENVQVPSLDQRANTPPFSTVPDDPAKGGIITPSDQPTVINLCSPVKKMSNVLEQHSGATQTAVSANGQKNAFAIMMQRSKENLKRKALFPSGRVGKV